MRLEHGTRLRASLSRRKLCECPRGCSIEIKTYTQSTTIREHALLRSLRSDGGFMTEQYWTKDCEGNWYDAVVLRFGEYHLTAILGDIRNTYDQRYRTYVHRSVVAKGFGSAGVGTRLKFWEALECVVIDSETNATQIDGASRGETQ